MYVDTIDQFEAVAGAFRSPWARPQGPGTAERACWNASGRCSTSVVGLKWTSVTRPMCSRAKRVLKPKKRHSEFDGWSCYLQFSFFSYVFNRAAVLVVTEFVRESGPGQ